MTSPPSVSNSRIFAVPQLDERSLNTLPSLDINASAMAAAADKMASHLSGDKMTTSVESNNNSMSKGPEKTNGSTSGRASSHGGFTLVADGIPGIGSAAGNGSFMGAGSNPPSPSRGAADASDLLFLQQQQAAAVAAAAAQLEQDYFYTQMLLQQSPRPILLAVLTSLMEDFPTTLISPIKARLEHFISANTALKSNLMVTNGMAAAGGPVSSPSPIPGPASPAASLPHSGRRVSAAAFVPNTNAAPWTPASSQQQAGTSVTTTPYSHSHSPSHSRGNNTSTGSKGKGKGNKEEQEMCSIHHCKRAVKHLHLNPETGLHECIHGFHCLVDEPVAPRRDDSALGNGSRTSAGGGFTVVGGDSTTSSAPLKEGLEGSDSCIGGSARKGLSNGQRSSPGRFIDPMMASGSPGVLQGGHGRGSGSTASDTRADGSAMREDELLAFTMKLLQSVRDIEEEEE